MKLCIFNKIHYTIQREVEMWISTVSGLNSWTRRSIRCWLCYLTLPHYLRTTVNHALRLPYALGQSWWIPQLQMWIIDFFFTSGFVPVHVDYRSSLNIMHHACIYRKPWCMGISSIIEWVVNSDSINWWPKHMTTNLKLNGLGPTQQAAAAPAPAPRWHCPSDGVCSCGWSWGSSWPFF